MIADVRSRDLFVAGITLYWAEGSKDKPWRRTGRVILINNDPDVLRLFLAWLDLLGVAEQDRHYRLSIHESADARWHEQWWAEALAIPLASFARATLKKHKPITVRYNVGGTYHGCLIVTVLRSRHLYDVIEGAWRALVEQVANGVDSAHWSRSGPP